MGSQVLPGSNAPVSRHTGDSAPCRIYIRVSAGKAVYEPYMYGHQLARIYIYEYQLARLHIYEVLPGSKAPVSRHTGDSAPCRFRTAIDYQLSHGN